MMLLPDLLNLSSSPLWVIKAEQNSLGVYEFTALVGLEQVVLRGRDVWLLQDLGVQQGLDTQLRAAGAHLRPEEQQSSWVYTEA